MNMVTSARVSSLNGVRVFYERSLVMVRALVVVSDCEQKVSRALVRIVTSARQCGSGWSFLTT